MHERRFSAPVVGSSSLLVIFAVLCLTVFALLGLSSVQANGRLSDVSAQAVADYYAADCQAEAILARLRAGESVEGVDITATPEGRICSYTCPISETQILSVEVQLEGADWTVLRWQAVSTALWESDEALSVWDGTSVP